MAEPTTDGTIGKALDVLDHVSGFSRPVRFSELMPMAGLPKTTLFRLVRTLTQQRMLSYDPASQTYSLGLRLVRLAHTAWRQSSLAPVARPFLDTLATKIGETLHLAQMDGGQVLYVDKRNAKEPVEMFSQAGKIGPGYCTGVGKAMMAYLPDDERAKALACQSFFAHTDHTLTSADALEAEFAAIREAGVAYDREEHEPGIICIAAPILTAQGRVIGALSVTSTTRRTSLTGLDRYRADLINTSDRIARAATSWQFPEPVKGH